MGRRKKSGNPQEPAIPAWWMIVFVILVAYGLWYGLSVRSRAAMISDEVVEEIIQGLVVDTSVTLPHVLEEYGIDEEAWGVAFRRWSSDPDRLESFRRHLMTEGSS